jgi:hypothetical protein
MRLDIKWVECEGVDGAVVPGNFWSCGGGFARFARGGARQSPSCLASCYRSAHLPSLILHALYVFYMILLYTCGP